MSRNSVTAYTKVVAKINDAFEHDHDDDDFDHQAVLDGSLDLLDDLHEKIKGDIRRFAGCDDGGDDCGEGEEEEEEAEEEKEEDEGGEESYDDDDHHLPLSDMRTPKCRARAKRNAKRGHTGGILVAVYSKNGRVLTKQIKPSVLAPGKQLRGCCVHLVGGTRSNCSLTPHRRHSVAAKHAQACKADGVHCPLHISNWKAIANRSSH